MIDLQRIRDGLLLFLPLCPSTNARTRPVRMGSRCQTILTRGARDYISSVGWAIKALVREEKIKPITDYTYLDLWFILPRTNCDAHNYGKVLFDAMQVGGLVSDDRYLLPRVMGVTHHGKTGVIMKIPDLKNRDRLLTQEAFMKC